MNPNFCPAFTSKMPLHAGYIQYFLNCIAYCVLLVPGTNRFAFICAKVHWQSIKKAF